METDKKVYQLARKLVIKVELGIWSGLHIGGTNNAMEIGGLNGNVIRDPLKNEPYIPGSSLKGKMRALLEVAYGTIGEVQNGPTDTPDSRSSRLFGFVSMNSGGRVAKGDIYQSPSRLIVRDSYLTQKSKDKLRPLTDRVLTQTKTEVVIDRITSSANPRTIERVPRGAIFSCEFILNLFSTDVEFEEELIADIFNALILLEDDYLGGNGSRGYGEVDCRILAILERNKAYYFGDSSGEKDITGDLSIPDRLKSFSHSFPTEVVPPQSGGAS